MILISGQDYLSTLMARQDSAPCAPHVFLMILVYRNIYVMYSYRKYMSTMYYIRVPPQQSVICRDQRRRRQGWFARVKGMKGLDMAVGNFSAAGGEARRRSKDGLVGFLMAKDLRGNTRAIKHTPAPSFRPSPQNYLNN